MCAWNSTGPDGTKSVKQNETILQDNTTYTETTLNNDHFWNIGANEDGRHQFVQSPKYTVGGVPASPALGAGMDLALFARLKTATESPAQQDVQPYARNSADIMQILGIRSCVLFNLVAFVPNILYAHNVASVSRTNTGKYTITYTNALPSADYIVLGGGVRNDSGADKRMNFSVASTNATPTSTKSTAKVDVLTTDISGSFIDPLQIWAVCFGG